MAGVAGFLPAQEAVASAASKMPAAATDTEAQAMVVRVQFDVEFSRFFNFPRRCSPAPAGLRPLSKAKIRSKGTWITAATPALLRILQSPHAASTAVLVVFVLGVVHVSCVPSCPIRGSRVVFLSYRDSAGQIQKFAVRFPTSCDAEAFLNFVKECSRETMDIAPSESDFVCGNSSPSEFIASNGLHCRFEEESRFEEPNMSFAQDLPALSYHDKQPACPPHPVLAKDIDTIFSGFPPSFTDLLTNCSSDTGKEQTNPIGKTDLASKNAECSSNSSVHDAANQLKPLEDSDLKIQIAKYMCDASFHEMLFKLEKVIDELGGDLSL